MASMSRSLARRALTAMVPAAIFVLSAATLRHGITLAFRIDAGLAVAGFVVALAFVRGPRSSAAHAAAPVAHHRVRA